MRLPPLSARLRARRLERIASRGDDDRPGPQAQAAARELDRMCDAFDEGGHELEAAYHDDFDREGFDDGCDDE